MASPDPAMDFDAFKEVMAGDDDMKKLELLSKIAVPRTAHGYLPKRVSLTHFPS